MKRTIRSVIPHVCKHCQRTYWTTDEHGGYCDDCREMHARRRAEKKRRKAEAAGQLKLRLE